MYPGEALTEDNIFERLEENQQKQEKVKQKEMRAA